MLQEDSLPAKEIAEKLYGVIDLNWLIGQGKQEIESLCNKHLSFEKVKVEGKLFNELSQELGYDLKDKIIAEYQNYLDSYSTDEVTTTIISKIERSVELQTWSNGIVNMQEAIKLLVERVKNSSRSYGNLYTAPISENDILEKFNKAKENTLLERIQGNNKYYNEVMSWIDILDQVQENSRNTSLLRSTIEYAYGMSLYSAEKYMDAFERFDNSFNLKYDYIQSIDSYGRKDTYQEYRLMEIYKMIEACQITVAQSDLYRNQAKYVEAVEKYGKELIDIGQFDRERLCNCLFNYAAYFYNQTLDREDDEIKELLHNAHKYYEKVVSETEDSHLNGMYIRASFFNMICLARMGQEENIPKICTSILEKEKELGKYELNDLQIHEILKICHSMSESDN